MHFDAHTSIKDNRDTLFLVRDIESGLSHSQRREPVESKHCALSHGTHRNGTTHSNNEVKNTYTGNGILENEPG
jgi:hypothetical protein